MSNRQLIKETALCLRSVDYGDTSQVVCLLTAANGKVSAIAKGARRQKNAPFDGPIEVFSFGQAVLIAPQENDRLAVLTEFAQQPRFRPLRFRLEPLQAGLFAAEITDLFCHPWAECRDIFDSLCQRLEQMQNASCAADIAGATAAYLLDILRAGGVLPQFDRCVNCRQPLDPTSAELFFSSSANGLLCFDCETNWAEKQRVSADALLWLAASAEKNAALNVRLDSLELLIRHFRDMLHRDFKTAPMLITLLRKMT